MELKELNWLYNHMKNVKGSEPCISMNFCTKFSKDFIWNENVGNKYQTKTLND